MIKYNLKCSNNHEFESWFSDSSEFDKLNKKNLLACIYCSSNKISKSIMSPMVTVSKKNIEKFSEIEKTLKREKTKLIEIRKYIENNFEYVGTDFSKKVREIYYDDKSKKTIYGPTTSEDRKECFAP